MQSKKSRSNRTGPYPFCYWHFAFDTHRGTGSPTEEEIGAMLRCAHELREEGLDSAGRAGSKRYGKFKGKA